MNLALEKGERVTTGAKSRGESASIVVPLSDLLGPSPLPMSPSLILTSLLTSLASAPPSTSNPPTTSNTSTFPAAIPHSLNVPYLFPKPSVVGASATTPVTSPASPPISPLSLLPAVTLSPFSNARFIAPLHLLYPKPNPFVPKSPPTTLVFIL